MSVSETVFFGEDTAQWLDAIHDARAVPIQKVTAQTFGRDLPGNSSRPVLLTCDDGRDYVVKGVHAGRMPVNDQVVGRLGRAMNAPIPRVVLVDVPEELIQMQPEMAHMTPGLAHGSEVLPAVVDSYLIEHMRKGDGNRGRFARLAVLWGVVGVFDKQYLYSDDDPPRVYSADHGHAFPGGPEWTRRSLTRPRAPALPDPEIVDKCHLTDMEIDEAARKLSGIDDARIARIVAAPPDGWGFDMPDRVALAQFISRRRREMLQALNVTP
jgi:hypothetical protein